MDANTTKIITDIAALLAAAAAGSFLTYTITKRSNKVKQRDIKIKGDSSKVVGGDDNSRK